MFLLRTAFWLSLVIVLLPADSGEQAPRVTAFEAISAAQAAVSDLSQFCERNPDVCVTGGSAFEVFADKVRYGAKMISGYFSDKESKAGSSTLEPADAEPEWQGPSSRTSKSLDRAA